MASRKKRVPASALPGRQPPTRASRTTVYAALIALSCAAAYWPALQQPFLFDDQTAIVTNASIRSLTPLSNVLSPPRDTPVAGRPLVNLSFALNYDAGGVNPFGYRLGNLAIHIVAGLVLFALARRALFAPRLAGQFAEAATPLAFAVALLWTLHPLNSEVVDYVTQRTESLMALAYLLTIYCAQRAAGAGAGRWMAASVASCAAGMLCKESMVTAPVMVALIDRILVFDSWRGAFRARGRLYAGLAATWVVLAAILLSAPRTSVGFDAGTTPWIYLLNQARLVPRYLWLAVWPRPLVLDYGLPQPLTLADVWAPGLLVVALAAATVAALVYRPLLGLAGAWFFMTLAPTSSIVPIATEVGAERRMYLPLVAIVSLVVLTSAEAYRLVRSRRAGAGSSPTSRAIPVLGWGVLATTGILFAAGLVARGQEYASELTMAETIVDRWPNGRGRFMLGTALIETGRHEAGMALLRESARDFPGALFAIATEQLGAGQYTEGIDTIQRFIRALPNHVNIVPAREMLGRAYVIQQNLPGAREQFEQVVRLAPRYAGGHDLLGRVLAAQGQFPAAAAQFQAVLALNPGDAEARRNLEAMQRAMGGPAQPGGR